jgi:ketosteroid isomerase-like protein
LHAWFHHTQVMMNARLISPVAIVALLLVVAGGAAGQEASSRTRIANADSAAVARVVMGFHDALIAGDSLRAMSLLDSSVVILESGDTEDRAEYRAHHLAADIEFARATHTTSAPLRITVRGDVGWVTGTSTTTGSFRGRAINSSGAELVILIRQPVGWRIAAIHWSSHASRSP